VSLVTCSKDSPRVSVMKKCVRIAPVCQLEICMYKL
jgi:hypothetical protein